MARLNLDVRRVAGVLGAEIHGIDLAESQPDATIADIRALLLEYGVIFFRDQTLDDAKLKTFARRFGSLFRHPHFPPEGDPDVIVVRRAPGDKRIVGEGWHSDTPAVAAPPMASLLYGEDVPPHGGDTRFANQYLALETLSPDLRKMLEGLRVVYSDSRFAGATAGRNAISATKSREDAAFSHSPGRASGRADTSRDRPPGILRRAPADGTFRWHDRGGKRWAGQVPLRSQSSSGGHLIAKEGRQWP